MSGVMATIATTPKASLTILSDPPMASQAPIAKGSRKVAVIGPDATPPESKAMDVNIFGAAKERARASIYPGSRKYITEMPVSTLIMASPKDTATPMERESSIALAGMDPAVSSSTCLLSTCTAGSALTIKYPIVMAIGISIML